MGRAGLVTTLIAAACVVGAHAADQPAPLVSRQLLVGIDDDTAKWLNKSNRLVATYRHLGIDAVRLTIPWRRGQNRPTAEVGIYLHRAAAMVARGQRVVLAVYGRPWQAPLDDVQRRHYARFLKHVLTRIPKIRDVVVWNEVNSPEFWPAAGGPAAYEALLAECWDQLRGLRPYPNIISSTAAKHDPARFMREVGAAYRASGRKKPILTTFGHNPYPVNAAEPPWVRHDDPTNVSQADLPRYLDALRYAFAGTKQPLPSAARPIVWYMENGFQTTVARDKRRHYHGEETDHWTVPPVAPPGLEPWYRDQASQLRDALYLAHCQPEVGAFFNFELIDEDRLAGWQSGVMWRDGTRKPSYAAFREAVAAVGSGEVDCATVPGAGGPVPERPLDAAAGQPG
ncbi:MAG TPA: hypothetical protein VFR32_06485 [Gaiellaceae bacterium]|nr:hypothetical protein [Gaiellaceae bacterium]